MPAADTSASGFRGQSTPTAFYGACVFLLLFTTEKSYIKFLSF
ncbi:hypothetical protein CLOSTHATH_03155 [Hungatella hathewayi DSM 13479]|uniref:Uncharacterized protein n=1 Tax=Hungatella hathewayi DSM 13479 TaxID=566550 RepID=D3AHR6_9FIRM|nr:hypothetical protein CLOSTHATH_03155 [Hungatella hathewayi DSM 13479]